MIKLKPKPKMEDTTSYKAVEWLHNYPGLPYLVASPLGMALAGNLSVVWASSVLYLASAGFLLRGSVLATQGQQTISSLQRENSLFREGSDDRTPEVVNGTRDTVNRILRSSFQKAMLGPHDRATVYSFREDSDVFVAIARHSDNPNWCSVVRDSYPNGQGIIALAWADGSADFEHPNGEDETEYNERLKNQFHIPLSTGRKIRMRSRSLVAKKLENVGSEPKAVLVVESTESGTDRLFRASNSIAQQESALVAMIEVIDQLSSSPEAVAEEGF